MKKAIVVLVLLVGAASAAGYLYLVLSGPRMRYQPHIRAYEALMPQPAPGSVPVTREQPLPGPDQVAQVASPVPDTPDNRKRGEVYYRYYCSFCHGDQGRGDGPVGHSYMPAPPDFRSDKVRAMNDGQLLRAMLLGVGHEPVLERVVPWSHRWPLILYVRALASSPAPQPAQAPSPNAPPSAQPPRPAPSPG